MRTIADAKQNQAAGITPWLVTKVNALPTFKLFVQFVDGTEGIVDMAKFLNRDCGVFKALRDTTAFMSVHVEGGAVTWENELDLAPDRMHSELQKGDTYVMQ